MSDVKGVQDIDLESLRDFKKSLVCSKCTRFPRPGSEVYTCPDCNKIVCSSCTDEFHGCLKYCPNISQGYPSCRMTELKPFCYNCGGYRIGHTTVCPNQDINYSAECRKRKLVLRCTNCAQARSGFVLEPTITKFISFFKFHPCINIQNGCNDEFEAKDLEDHEKSCFFRNITCPDKNCSASIVFNDILDHYKKAHPKVESKDEVLRFKGTIEQLKTSVFILNCYGKPFFPQFCSDGKFLYVCVIGHGEKYETNSFDVMISFFYDGKWNLNAKDIVRPLGLNKFTFLDVSLPFNLKTIQRYFDVLENDYKNQQEIEFKMKIICEKIDEVAKDKDVESGVEDTDNDGE